MTDTTKPAVTREEAMKFLEIAIRNWSDVQELSQGDADDVATALSWFLGKRSALSGAPAPETHVGPAARAFMDLFVVDNGDERSLSIDGIDMIELTHRYVALEAALEAAKAAAIRSALSEAPAPEGGFAGGR